MMVREDTGGFRRDARPARRLLIGRVIRAGRVLSAVVSALVAAAVTAVPVSSGEAGGGETGDVVFRVTLEGPVDPSHTFTVSRTCVEERCAIEDAEFVCSPPNVGTGGTCASGTYEFTAQIEVGLTLEYALKRWTDPAGQPQEFLHGSWVVHQGRQVISLGFDYSPGGDQPLPDTAMRAP